MRSCNAAVLFRFEAPGQPFFLYYAPGGSHSPHQPTPEWIEKFKGKFDMGWNAMRDVIFANQKRLGVIPADAELTPWPDSLAKWETLTADEKKLFARKGLTPKASCFEPTNSTSTNHELQAHSGLESGARRM